MSVEHAPEARKGLFGSFLSDGPRSACSWRLEPCPSRPGPKRTRCRLAHTGFAQRRIQHYAQSHRLYKSIIGPLFIEMVNSGTVAHPVVVRSSSRRYVPVLQ